MIALILHSCYRLANLGMEDWLQWVIALVCLAVTVIPQAEVAFLFIGAGIIGILYYGNLSQNAGVKLQIAAVPLLIAPLRELARRSVSCCCSFLRLDRLRSVAGS